MTKTSGATHDAFVSKSPNDVQVGDYVQMSRRRPGSKGQPLVGRVVVAPAAGTSGDGKPVVVLTVQAGGQQFEERVAPTGDVRVLDGARTQALTHTGDTVSYTELARIVAAQSDWLIDTQGRLIDSAGAVIADSIGELARALFMLGWIGPVNGGPNAVQWTRMPHVVHQRDEIAGAVRDTLTDGAAAWLVGRPVPELLRFFGLSLAEAQHVLEAAAREN